MIKALKITADRIALCGLVSRAVECVQRRICRGKRHRNDCRYFARSAAVQKIVSERRVNSICLSVSTIAVNFVGFESKATRVPASLATCVPEVIATATSA
jgi:hypothetical protein